MRIAYLFNSSTPSSNPSSIQVVNTCSALSQLSHHVKLIVPNTGKDVSLLKFYGINKSPKLIKLRFFNKFPLHVYYYLFSFFSIAYAIFDKTELYITRNIFNLILLNILKKKVIIEIHHDLHNEGRLVKFLCKYINVFNKENPYQTVEVEEEENVNETSSAPEGSTVYKSSATEKKTFDGVLTEEEIAVFNEENPDESFEGVLLDEQIKKLSQNPPEGMSRAAYAQSPEIKEKAIRILKRKQAVEDSKDAKEIGETLDNYYS